mgnify:CR=1 FL=1
MFAIAAHELRGLFLSPLAWTLLAAFQGLLAWIFLVLVEDFRNLQGRLIGLENAPGVTDLVAAPLDLLLSAPVSATAIVLGKYLGILLFLSGAIALVASMPLALALGATLDYGKLLAGLLGLVLLAASFAAAGLYLSTLTAQPVIAAVSTSGLLLFLYIVDVAHFGRAAAADLLGYLSLARHFDHLLLGVFDSADVAYYLLFGAAFLGLAIRRLDDGRLRD